MFALLLSLLIFLPGSSIAQSPADQINKYVKAEMERQRIPGLAVVVQKGSRIVHESYLGQSNIELNSSVNEKTAFSIASMSKIYTAAAVHLLAERGTVNLSDSVRKYLVDAPKAWQDITLQHLINHQSGLVDDWGLHDDWGNTHRSIFARAKSNQDFLDVHYARPLLFEPGTGLRYAAGTFVLGIVIEQVSGKSYARFMHEDVLEPLGLKETWVDDPLVVMPHRAAGYLCESKKLTTGHRLSPVTLARGDVSIRASARDVAKFLDALRNGKLVKDATRMFEYGKRNDGSLTTRSNGGWFTWYIRGTATRDHGGIYRTGFSSIMIEFVEDDLTVIVLTNMSDTPCFRMAIRIASFFQPDYHEIRDLPLEKKSVSTTPFFNALRAVAARTHDSTVLHENFPMGMYEHLGDSYEDISKVEYLGRKDMTSKKRVMFAEPLRELVFLRLDESKYAEVYLAQDGKVLFVGLPEKSSNTTTAFPK